MKPSPRRTAPPRKRSPPRKCRPRDRAPGELPSFPESVRAILAAETSDGELRETLGALGLKPTVLNAIHLGMSNKAAKGDPSAAKYLRDTAADEDEDPRDRAPELPDLSALTDGELRRLAGRLGDRDG